MDVTKPYQFIWFGAMGVTKPYKFIGFGAMDVTKPYKFMGSECQSAKHCVTGRFSIMSCPPLPPGGPGEGPDCHSPEEFYDFGPISARIRE